MTQFENDIHPSFESAEKYIGTATRALTEANAEPERVKIYHNGRIYLDIPLMNGRLVCPVKVNRGLWQVEIWGSYQDETTRCLFTSETIEKK